MDQWALQRVLTEELSREIGNTKYSLGTTPS